jgi:hypothetical protein
MRLEGLMSAGFHTLHVMPFLVGPVWGEPASFIPRNAAGVLIEKTVRLSRKTMTRVTPLLFFKTSKAKIVFLSFRSLECRAICLSLLP